MDDRNRSVDENQESSTGFHKWGSKREPVNMAKQKTRVVEIEYINIKDSDSDNKSIEHLLQTRRQQHHVQQSQSQMKKLLEQVEMMMLENENPHLRTLVDGKPAARRVTFSCHVEIPLEEKDGEKKKYYGGRAFTAASFQKSKNPINEHVPISGFQPKQRKLQRSNSTASAEKSLECVRIVLIGKTGVGKSATGNTILGHDVFVSRARMVSVTRTCQKKTGEACGRSVTVVDTPGLFDTTLSNEEIQQEIMRCIELSAPGPHVFLLVIALGPFTQEERETLQLIKMTFGQKAEAYTMVLFTRGDNLDESIEDYIKDGDPQVQKLIDDCGGRFHVFNNKQKDPGQVVSLLKKIDKMMWSNNSSFYNDKMFQDAERTFRLMQINREREVEVRQEMEAIKAKYESEIKEIQDKLEEEKEKLKVRDLLLAETQNKLCQTGQIIDDGVKNDEKENTGTQQEAIGGEYDQHKNKQKIKRFASFLFKDAKPREKYQKRKHLKNKETTSQEEKCDEIKPTDTDQNIKTDTPMFSEENPLQTVAPKKLNEEMYLPKNPEDDRYMNKNKLLFEQYKAMKECKCKMEEIKRRYKEIQEIHDSELKEMKKRHADNITAWKRNNDKNCVLQ